MVKANEDPEFEPRSGKSVKFGCLPTLMLSRCTYLNLNLYSQLLLSVLPSSNFDLLVCRVGNSKWGDQKLRTPDYQVQVKKASRYRSERQEGLSGRKRVLREEGNKIRWLTPSDFSSLSHLSWPLSYCFVADGPLLRGAGVLAPAAWTSEPCCPSHPRMSRWARSRTLPK